MHPRFQQFPREQWTIQSTRPDEHVEARTLEKKIQ